MNVAKTTTFIYKKTDVMNKISEKNKKTNNKLFSNESILELKTRAASQELNSSYINNIRTDSYVTMSGVLIDNCNAEYAKEFDEISFYFEKAVRSGENMLEDNILEQMASKYENLRNNILKKYSSDDLDKELEQLDNAYEIITKFNVAGVVEGKLFEAQSREDARAMFTQMKEKCAREKGQKFAEMAFGGVSYEGKNTVFNKALYNKVFTMSTNVMRLAERAKQYIKDGNHAPVTKDEKSAFNQYISAGTDSSIGNLSYYDIKAVLSVVGNVQKLDSKWLSDRDNYNNILNSFNNSGFSDEIKNLFSNVLNQTSWNNYEPKDEQEKIAAEIIDLIEKRETNLYERKNSSEVLTDDEKYKRYVEDAKYNNIIDDKMETLFNIEKK